MKKEEYHKYLIVFLSIVKINVVKSDICPKMPLLNP